MNVPTFKVVIIGKCSQTKTIWSEVKSDEANAAFLLKSLDTSVGSVRLELVRKHSE
jgi:hypothetical protein